MSKKTYIVLQPKKTIVDVEYSDGTVVSTESRIWYEGEVAHIKFFVDDNKQIAELKEQRHKICEKIKEVFDEHRKILHSNYDECIFSMDEIIEELCQIEKEKSNE